MDKKREIDILMVPSICSHVPREYLQINDIKEEEADKRNRE